MEDLIKRSDAIKAVEELPNAYNGWSDAYDKAYIIGTLEEVPSAEITHDDVMQYCNSRLLVLATVESIKHQYRIGFEDGKASADRPQGEWIENPEGDWDDADRGEYECSFCGFRMYPYISDEAFREKYKFCPNCGARMKGAEDED